MLATKTAYAEGALLPAYSNTHKTNIRSGSTPALPMATKGQAYLGVHHPPKGLQTILQEQQMAGVKSKQCVSPRKHDFLVPTQSKPVLSLPNHVRHTQTNKTTAHNLLKL